MVSRPEERSPSIRCPCCGTGMEYRGQTMLDIAEHPPLTRVVATFRVYSCRTCQTLELLSFENPDLYNRFEMKSAKDRALFKNCISCQNEIPIASEECEFCGSKQPPCAEAGGRERQLGEEILQQEPTGFGNKTTETLESEKVSIVAEASSGAQSKTTLLDVVKERSGVCMVCQGPVGKGISDFEYSAMNEESMSLSKQADDLRAKIRELETKSDTIKVTGGQGNLVKRYLLQLFEVNRELLPLKERLQKGAAYVDTDVVACPHCGNVAHKIHMLEWLHVKGTCPVCHQHVTYPELSTRDSQL